MLPYIDIRKLAEGIRQKLRLQSKRTGRTQIYEVLPLLFLKIVSKKNINTFVTIRR